ncbi:MAG: hypothetical protein LBK41_07045, partial [Clostridiales bacterium]|nr:hypothetical protein [Clostridiales bacterium]
MSPTGLDEGATLVIRRPIGVVMEAIRNQSFEKASQFLRDRILHRIFEWQKFACFEPRKIPRPDQVFAENLIEKRVAHPWNFTWFTQNSSSS